MRAKRKRVLYIFFLLITVMMFFRSLQVYMAQREDALEYARQHHRAIPQAVPSHNPADATVLHA